MTDAPCSSLIFEARNVCKYFKQGAGGEVRALDDVCLKIARGSFSLLTGPSGCGKTTLLAVLGAMERPSRGQVLFLGRDLARFSDVELARARRRIGFVFQDFSLIPSLPVWENITYPLVPCGVPRTTRFERARALLERFALESKLLARTTDLSGGEQQRVALARALVQEPEVILADEPTSNLDPDASRGVLAGFRRLQAEGRTIVVASHDPGFGALATDSYELARGKLVPRS
jgi:putative ABC transport system ATP-binding protein